MGYFKEIKGKEFVDLNPVAMSDQAMGLADSSGGEAKDDLVDFASTEDSIDPIESIDPVESPASRKKVEDVTPNRKVFISHGKNRRIVDQLKQILAFGDFEPVVSVDRESSSKPVPKKVLDDMRACSAGIIHLSPEPPLPESENGEIGAGVRILNQNVLIEIGAAMALFDDRFILLVENETELPSNLQGLYEVRYSGDELAFDSIMKVLNAVKSVNSSQ